MVDKINSGEKVILLAATAQSAGLVGGAVAGTMAGWITKHNVAIAGTAFVIGAFIGWTVGKIIGRFIFPAPDKQVKIVKRRPSSLPLTLKGNIVASFVSALVVCLIAVVILNADIVTIAGPSIGTSVVIGVVLAMLASLT